MTRFIKIILFQSRPFNLVITVIVMFYSAFISTNNLDFLTDKSFFLYEVMVILVLMATGYWTNDAFDIKVDIYKKRERNLLRSRKEAILLIVFSQALATAAVLFSLLYPFPVYVKVMNITAYVLLFFYSSVLKRISPVGSIIIALLSSLILYIPPMFYGFKEANGWLAVFAFGITFIREITKDLEDLHPDLQAGRKTLPILIGTKKTHNFLIISYIIFFLTLLTPVFYHYIVYGEFIWKYLTAITFLVIVPLCFNLLDLLGEFPKYSKQSFILKIVIFGGLISVYFVIS